MTQQQEHQGRKWQRWQVVLGILSLAVALFVGYLSLASTQNWMPFNEDGNNGNTSSLAAAPAAAPPAAPAAAAPAPNIPTFAQAEIQMRAPAPITPLCKSEVSMMEDSVKLSWTTVPEASTYTLEVDCYNCSPARQSWYSVRANSPWRLNPGIFNNHYNTVVHKESEGQPMHWRVWGVDAQGREGRKSPWCQLFPIPP